MRALLAAPEAPPAVAAEAVEAAEEAEAAAAEIETPGTRWSMVRMNARFAALASASNSFATPNTLLHDRAISSSYTHSIPIVIYGYQNGCIHTERQRDDRRVVG